MDYEYYGASWQRQLDLRAVGAYALAWELARHPQDHAAAFARYETTMRPFVEVNQAIGELSRDPRFGSDPAYYVDVIEPAMLNAESAVELQACDWQIGNEVKGR
jgi:hypothetical protein